MAHTQETEPKVQPALVKVFMPPDLKQQLREFAAKIPSPMNDVMITALRRHLCGK